MCIVALKSLGNLCMVDKPGAWPYVRFFAHRCGGALAPENTLAGLSVARSYGFGVEFDVMLSADGTPFLMHDETVDRTTNGRGRMSDCRDVVLRQLDAGARFDQRFSGEPVPTLVDIARSCIDWGVAVNLEIKPVSGFEAETGRVVAQVASRLWQGGAPTPLLSSFSERALAFAASVAPQFPRGLLVDRLPPDWRERCLRLGVHAMHANARYLDAAQVAALKSAGLWVVVYTENDPESAVRLLDWGVDCIITDRPDRMAGL